MLLAEGPISHTLCARVKFSIMSHMCPEKCPQQLGAHAECRQTKRGEIEATIFSISLKRKRQWTLTVDA